MNSVVVALGSNIDPLENIQKACKVLAQRFCVRATSSFVQTAPLGLEGQPDFLNGVVLLETDMQLDDLKYALKALERELGRRGDKWAPREIDMDVLMLNGQVVNNDYYERDFLRKAVAEIAPALKLRCC